MSDVDFKQQHFGPSDAEFADHCDKEDDRLAEEDARMSLDEAFKQTIRPIIAEHGVGTILIKLAIAIPYTREDYIKRMGADFVMDFELQGIGIARFDGWPHVLRLIADVMDAEGYRAARADPRRI